MRPPRIAKVDYCAFLVGIPKAGKSSLAKGLAGRWLEAAPNTIALVHDPARDWNVPHVDRWEDFLSLMTRRPRPRAVGFSCEWSELVAGVTALGERVNSQTSVALPMMLISDETSALDTSGRTYMGKADMKLITMRRHLGVSLALNLQRVSNLPETVWGLVTDLYVFRLTAPKDAALLAERAGMREGALDFALSLEQGAYRHVELGFERRLVREPLWRPEVA